MSDRPDLRKLLASAELFRELSSPIVEQLISQVFLVSFETGDALVEQGGHSDYVYIVTEGRFSVEVDQGGDRHRVAHVEPGECVGEMSLATGGRCSATVVALEPSRVLALSVKVFEKIGAAHPQVGELLERLVEKRLPRLVLAGSGLLEGFDEQHLDELESSLSWVRLRGGDFLFHQGDPGDALYILVVGRLRVVADVNASARRQISEVRPLASVGEMALLSNRPRNASVLALRASRLIRLSRRGFLRLLVRHPQALLPMVHTLIDRLIESRQDRPGFARPDTIAVQPLGQWSMDFGSVLAHSLEARSTTVRIDSARFAEVHGSGAAENESMDSRSDRIAQWLDEQERRHDFVVYESEPTPGPWADRCLRQADRVLLVAHASKTPQDIGSDELIGELSGELEATDLDLANPGRRELVLLRDTAEVPTGATAAWLASLGVSRVHHVREGHSGGVQRLARLLSGRAVGLVLGGGGARALSHIGLIRALEEHEIAVDMVCGTSMGACVAGLTAKGCSWQEMVELGRTAFVDARFTRRYNYPAVSLLSGRELDRQLQLMFGETRIEDFPIEFFCVSTNLTRASLVEHRQGLAWRAVRASAAMPAVFPPAVSNGEVIVDGAVLDNIPVRSMHRQCPGAIITVDVSPPVDVEADPTLSECPSAGNLLWRRIVQDPVDVPSLGDILNRSLACADLAAKSELQRLSSLYLTPPMEEFSFMGGERIDEIVEAGYRYALEALEDFAAP